MMMVISINFCGRGLLVSSASLTLTKLFIDAGLRESGTKGSAD